MKNRGSGGIAPCRLICCHFAAGKMVSKCGCVGTHPMLGILLANRFRFAGSDCHRAGGFEPIMPYPAYAFMYFGRGVSMNKEKTATVPAHGCANIFSSFGVLSYLNLRHLNRCDAAGQLLFGMFFK